MSEQQWQSRTVRQSPQQQTPDQVVGQTTPVRDDAAFDALLDEIDSVLESNAEEYVRSFVQKGGQ